MAKHFHDAGMKLAANIKPCLLQDHPRYEEVEELGLFIKDSESNAPERSMFWDDEDHIWILPIWILSIGGSQI